MPRAGQDYPGSVGELLAWFSSDAACRDYLEWLRWPEGFVCSQCGQAGGWRLGDGRWMCAGCSHRTSVTAGTIFDRTRTPLTVWFTACWLFATQKDGISALSLKRALEIGSYQTAWAMLHRLRCAHFADGGHDLRPNAHAADGVVDRLLAVRDPEGRDLGAEPQALARDRLLPDGVGDAASLALGARASRS